MTSWHVGRSSFEASFSDVPLQEEFAHTFRNLIDLRLSQVSVLLDWLSVVSIFLGTCSASYQFNDIRFFSSIPSLPPTKVFP